MALRTNVTVMETNLEESGGGIIEDFISPPHAHTHTDRI